MGIENGYEFQNERLHRFDVKLKTLNCMIGFSSRNFIVVQPFKFDWTLTTLAVHAV
jgi:hypothetical protein